MNVSSVTRHGQFSQTNWIQKLEISRVTGNRKSEKQGNGKIAECRTALYRPRNRWLQRCFNICKRNNAGKWITRRTLSSDSHSRVYFSMHPKFLIKRLIKRFNIIQYNEYIKNLLQFTKSVLAWYVIQITKLFSLMSFQFRVFIKI